MVSTEIFEAHREDAYFHSALFARVPLQRAQWYRKIDLHPGVLQKLIDQVHSVHDCHLK